MYVLRAICPSTGHHGEFGTFVNHSCLLEQQILGEELWKFQSQTGGIWRDQPDRMNVKLAKAIVSKKIF